VTEQPIAIQIVLRDWRIHSIGRWHDVARQCLHMESELPFDLHRQSGWSWLQLHAGQSWLLNT
jgi:hypothetical protein